MVWGGWEGSCTSIFDHMKLPVTPFCGDVPGLMMLARFPTISEWRCAALFVVSSAGRNWSLKNCCGVESGEKYLTVPKNSFLVQPGGSVTVSGPIVRGVPCAKT